MDENFYEALEPHPSFLAVANPDTYVPAPANWQIVITDVRNSTQAIQNGKYRAVNLVGASSIIALLNLVPDTDLPFTFGGDGATMLLPPDLMPAAVRALVATRQMARVEFGLDLRLGRVPVTDVRAEGYEVRVAKVQIEADYAQAVFDGGGLARADALIKDNAQSERYRIDADGTKAEADFSGLECRWNDIPSPHGETVTLLVTAATGDAERDRAVYRETIETIEAAYGGSDRYRPITPDVMDPTYSLKRLMGETKVRRPRNSLQRMGYVIKIWVLNFVLTYLVATQKTTISGVRWDRYIEKLVATSDFRKYDDTLRMVISGTAAQREALTRYLEETHAEGQLAYGMHVTDRALVTCVVFERMGRQVHFVDGAEGGYAMAARGLKRRLRQLAEPGNVPASG